MSRPRNIEPVVRICAVISSQRSVLDLGIELLRDRWGEVAERSEPVAFKAGGFYDDTMGLGLQKIIIAMKDYADPSGLADWKQQTNTWESELAESIRSRGVLGSDLVRPINLDAGYISQAKLMLATIKDRDHRVYLRDQIFAEVTLNYVGKKWVHHRWTYPSYRTEEVAGFAAACRARLREHILTNGLTRTA